MEYVCGTERSLVEQELSRRARLWNGWKRVKRKRKGPAAARNALLERTEATKESESLRLRDPETFRVCKIGAAVRTIRYSLSACFWRWVRDERFFRRGIPFFLLSLSRTIYICTYAFGTSWVINCDTLSRRENRTKSFHFRVSRFRCTIAPRYATPASVLRHRV